jgi:hypothetical protein
MTEAFGWPVVPLETIDKKNEDEKGYHRWKLQIH